MTRLLKQRRPSHHRRRYHCNNRHHQRLTCPPLFEEIQAHLHHLTRPVPLFGLLPSCDRYCHIGMPQHYLQRPPAEGCPDRLLPLVPDQKLPARRANLSPWEGWAPTRSTRRRGIVWSLFWK